MRRQRHSGTADGGYIGVVAYLLPSPDPSSSSSASRDARVQSQAHHREKPPESSIVLSASQGYPASLATGYADWFHRLQEIRRRWDQAFDRWSPHVTLIPPFAVTLPTDRTGGDSTRGARQSNRERSGSDVRRTPRHTAAEIEAQAEVQLEEISNRLARVCATFPRHELELNSYGIFHLRNYRNVHLRPQPSPSFGEGPVIGGDDRDKLIALQSGLQSVFDEATIDPSGRVEEWKGRRDGRRWGAGGGRRETPRSFNPHVSLGQARDQSQLQQLEEAAQGLVQLEDSPVRWTIPVKEVSLLVKRRGRGDSGSYRVWKSFPLAGGDGEVT